MAQEQSKIVNRIKGLMAHAGNCQTQEEAEAYMAKAFDLLAKHNLSMANLDATDQEKVNRDEHHGRTWNQPWEAQVWQAVAELYFCDFWITSRGTDPSTYNVVGRESNRLTVENVAEMVVETGKRMARAYAKDNPGNSVSLSNNFKKGFARGVCLKAKELMEAAKQEGTTGSNALVVLSVYEQTALENQPFMPHNLVITKNRGQVTDRMALANGAVAGSKMNLNPALKGATKPLSLR